MPIARSPVCVLPLRVHFGGFAHTVNEGEVSQVEVTTKTQGISKRSGLNLEQLWAWSALT